MLAMGGFTFWYAAFGNRGTRSGQDEVTDYGPPLEHFQLTQSTGEGFDSRQLQGQVWIANFFYSSCPSVCLQENIKVQELNNEYGHRGVKFVSITVDPEHDTPTVLSDYAKRFNADPQQWFFLTGDFEYVKRVGQDIFQFPVSRAHSERLIVVDRAGELQGAFHFKNPIEMQDLRTMVSDLLLEEPAEES